MIIGIDGNEANVKERVGVNVWAFELLKQFKETIGKRQETGSLKFVIYLSKLPIEDMPEESQIFRYRVIGPGKFWTRWRLPLDLYLYKPRPDVFLSLSHYSPKWAPIPRVVSIMDLSFLKYPDAFKPVVVWQLKNWTAESVEKAVHVIAISQFTKQQIIKYYQYPADKITVVYPGISKVFQIFKNIGEKYKISGKYFLFVGTRQPKKNLDRLIQAFELVRKKFPDIELIIAGKIWGQFKDKKIEEKKNMVEGIKYLGYVSNEDLPGLYAGAEGLILPSVYEGFGIPAVEAMRTGIPVLTSNTTSLAEVVAGAGILFNPLDIKDIADKIETVLSMNQIERQRLVKKGMIRAGQFSWSNAADQIIKILQLFK